MAKVYIINNANHDYSKAEKYGQLVNVTEGNLPIFKTDVVKGMLQKGLVDFTSEDYLLISGPALLSVLATVHLLSTMTDVKMLIFDAKEQAYTVRHLSAQLNTIAN